jgi:hypothetical protein
LHLEVSLQRLDPLRKRRARDVQPLGRPTEIQFLGYGDEVAQLAQLHRLIVVR